MAFKNEAVSSLTDLITKLDTWMATVGWTAEHLDTSTTAGTGGEWAMRRTNFATNIRFSASWDGAGTVANMAIYQYVDQNYVITSRPWGQANDSGNGLQASSPNSSIINERHVILTNTPIQYWGFEGDDYTYIVVETATGEYAHFGFGLLDKCGGDWTGGEFVYGQRNNLTLITDGSAVFDGMSFLLDGLVNDTPSGGGLANGMELMAATIHAEGFPDGPVSHKYGVCMGGKQGSPQTDFGNDRQGTPRGRILLTWGLRAGPWASGFHANWGTDLSGETRFWPIALTYYNATTGNIHGLPLAYMPRVYGCAIEHYTGQEVVLDENGNQYHIFPANEKWPGSGTGSSGYLGIAYRVDTYTDPGLPASVNDPTGWYSSRAAADYTLVSGEVTQLDDKSGNANHLTPGAGTGPTLLADIDGRNWIDFESVTPTILRGANADIDPDAGDFSCVVVFRVNNDTVQEALFGKIGAGNPHFGILVNFPTATGLAMRMRDTAAPIMSVEHDVSNPDYTDGLERIAGFTYDDALNDGLLYGGLTDGSSDPTTIVASDLNYVSGAITPTNDLFLGGWDGSVNFLNGQVAEILFYSKVLTDQMKTDLWAYLKEKWRVR